MIVSLIDAAALIAVIELAVAMTDVSWFNQGQYLVAVSRPGGRNPICQGQGEGENIILYLYTYTVIFISHFYTYTINFSLLDTYT